MKENNNKILLNLVNNFIHSFELKRTFFINYSNFAIFEGLSYSVERQGDVSFVIFQ